MEMKVYKGKNNFYHKKDCRYLSGDIKTYNSPEDAEKDKLIACTFCKPKEGFELHMNPPVFEEAPFDTSDMPFSNEVEEKEEIKTEEPKKEEQEIIGNNNNKSYHLPTCQYAPKNKAKRVEFKSIEEAKAAGYRACSTCNPK